MDRDSRTLIHKKQERIEVKDGNPTLGGMIEGVPALRYINGVMYLVVRYNNKLYYLGGNEGGSVTNITNISSGGSLSAHASSHEDGGGDEISISGLSGTPAALTTHMVDTSTHGVDEVADKVTQENYAIAMSVAMGMP